MTKCLCDICKKNEANEHFKVKRKTTMERWMYLE